MSEDLNNEYNNLLKSLKYFFGEILLSAQLEGDWSLGGIERGLGWALYCEKVAREPNVIHPLTSYLETNPFKHNYTIEHIQNLRKLLISKLFINQLIPKDVYSLLEEISVRELGNEKTQQLLNTSVKIVDNYQTVITTLKKPCFEATYNTFKVRLLLEAVSSASIPYIALNNLLKNDGSLKMLLQLSQTLCESEKNNFFDCIGEWMKMSLQKGNVIYLLFYQITSLSVSEVEFICEKFDGLQIKLLEIIDTVGVDLSINKDEVKYKSLVSLCHSFIKSENLSSVTKSAFSSWFRTKEAYFWHTLFVEAQKES